MRTLSYCSDKKVHLSNSSLERLFCFQYETSYTEKLDPKVLDDLHNLQVGLHSAREYQSSKLRCHFRIIWKPSPFSAEKK